MIFRIEKGSATKCIKHRNDFVHCNDAMCFSNYKVIPFSQKISQQMRFPFLFRSTSIENTSSSCSRSLSRREVASPALQCLTYRGLSRAITSTNCMVALPPSTSMRCFCREALSPNFLVRHFLKGKSPGWESTMTEPVNSGSTNR